MVCIYCGGKTQVINSRPQKRTNQVWRRRECRQCQAVFTTGEAVDYSAAWVVQNKANAIAPFSRDKLLMSIHKSVQHRTTAVTDAGDLADTVIHTLVRMRPGATITSSQLVQIIQVVLNRFDTAASVHYAAFHK